MRLERVDHWERIASRRRPAFSVERILRINEESKLLKACESVRTPALKPLLLLALHTGMRRGELLSLKWSEVDFGRRMIRVINSKTQSGIRLIPMNKTAGEALSKLSEIRVSEYVFASNRNEGQSLCDIKKGFKKAIRLAGIEDLRFHDLRHTFATRLVAAGVDLITVQHLLGHARITMTARYSHSLPETRIAAVQRLETRTAIGL